MGVYTTVTAKKKDTKPYEIIEFRSNGNSGLYYYKINNFLYSIKSDFLTEEDINKFEEDIDCPEECKTKKCERCQDEGGHNRRRTYLKFIKEARDYLSKGYVLEISIW